MMLPILKWHMIAETYPLVLARIYGAVFIFHRQVADEMKRHLLQLFVGHMIDGKVYKTKDKFIEALDKFEK